MSGSFDNRIYCHFSFCIVSSCNILIKAGRGNSARCLRRISTFIWTVYFMASNQEFEARLAINMSPRKMEALVLIFLHGPLLTNNNLVKRNISSIFPIIHCLELTHHSGINRVNEVVSKSFK